MATSHERRPARHGSGDMARRRSTMNKPMAPCRHFHHTPYSHPPGHPLESRRDTQRPGQQLGSLPRDCRQPRCASKHVQVIQVLLTSPPGAAGHPPLLLPPAPPPPLPPPYICTLHSCRSLCPCCLQAVNKPSHQYGSNGSSTNDRGCAGKPQWLALALVSSKPALGASHVRTGCHAKSAA